MPGKMASGGPCFGFPRANHHDNIMRPLLSCLRQTWSAAAAGLLWIPRRLRGLTGSLRFWALSLIVVLVVLVLYYALADRYAPLTTDAYVQAFVIQVAPQVEGRVVRVAVREADEVKTGDLLFELDPRPFEHKAALLEARLVQVLQDVKELDTDLAAARAEQERAQAEANLAGIVFQQERQLYKADSTTERRFLEAQEKNRASQAALRAAGEKLRHVEQALAARIGDDHARVAQVKAQLAEARLHLEYTRVYAPCDALITDLQLREGAYVRTGEAALTLIDLHHWIVVANFRENALTRLSAGQPALVALRGAPGQLLDARVTAVGRGVGQGQGVPSGKLPDVKRSSSWMPPSQRFQVRLELTEPQAVPLRVGMTASVSVYTQPEGVLNDITEAWHKLLAWLYYL